MKPVKCRPMRRAGTTLAELLVATVFTAAASASIISAMGFAGKRAQISQKRAMGLSWAMDSMEGARAAAKAGQLAASNRLVTIKRGGSGVVVSGTTFAGDTSPAAVSIGTQFDVGVKREITLEPGTMDLYKVKVVVYWNPFGVETGLEAVKLESYMRSPCD